MEGESINLAGEPIDHLHLLRRKRHGRAGRRRIGHQPPGDGLQQVLDAVAAQGTGQ